MANPDDPEKRKGLVEVPQYWPIPEDYDSWSIDKRQAYLEEELNVNVSYKEGTRLSNIHSVIIEGYLAKHVQENLNGNSGGP